MPSQSLQTLVALSMLSLAACGSEGSTTSDAGARSDAAVRPDSAVAPDAAVVSDATVGTDAAAHVDGGARADASASESTFAEKCARPGVVNCFDFDDQARIFYTWNDQPSACDQEA